MTMRRRNPPLSEHMAHDDPREILRLAVPRLERDPSEATEVAYGVVDAAIAGLARKPEEGEYAEAATICHLLEDAADSLREALALMHPGRDRWTAHRRNPSGMPPGFDSFSGDDVFGVSDESVGLVTPGMQTTRLIQGLRRGDVVKVGAQKFDVFQGNGSITVYVTKHGTTGRKYYTLRPDRDDGTVDVYQCDGMANLVGPSIAHGVPVKIGPSHRP